MSVQPPMWDKVEYSNNVVSMKLLFKHSRKCECEPEALWEKIGLAAPMGST